MQIAQVLAGYSLGGADLLRRAMGKKKPAEMAKQRTIFTQGAVARGVDADNASFIFDLMEKFAGYGFNKSHSAAYALVSYQTMWLKAHYPAAFMAAVLSADMDSTDKVVTLIEECRSMKLKVNPPHVNHSAFMFSAIDGDAIVYGLGAIKGVGESAIESIIVARDSGEPFSDLFDFCRRIELRKVNRRVLEALIRAGALDQLGANRATLMAQLGMALKMAEQHHALLEAGQNDLFGMDNSSSQLAVKQVVPPVTEEWVDELRLQGEKETLGLYLTGHPIDRYLPEFAGLGITPIAELSVDKGSGRDYRNRGQRVMVAGLTISVSHRQTQRGRMASMLLDDRSGRIEVTLFAEACESYRELLSADRVLVVIGNLSHDEYRGGLSLRVDQVAQFEQVRAANASSIFLKLNKQRLNGRAQASNDSVLELERILSVYRGGDCPVHLCYQADGTKLLLEPGDDWRVQPTDELLRRLERFTLAVGVEVKYGNKARKPIPPEQPDP